MLEKGNIHESKKKKKKKKVKVTDQETTYW
jgi:hypothetical protein